VVSFSSAATVNQTLNSNGALSDAALTSLIPGGTSYIGASLAAANAAKAAGIQIITIQDGGTSASSLQAMASAGNNFYSLNPQGGGGGGIVQPSRPFGAVIDSTNQLSTSLVGLFLMNEGTGTSDTNLVNGQPANFSGGVPPSWKVGDPSISFNGGPSLNSYLDAGTGLNFDQLTVSKMTIIAKIYVNSVGPPSAPGSRAVR
jgi:hypothetical protein